MTTQSLTEDQLVHSVRNALLVAGQEMGNGDQWPVIKDTINRLMQDWENFKVERNVHAEMKKHLYAELQNLEASLPECSPEAQAILRPKLEEWKEICDAFFSDLDEEAVIRDEKNTPEHIRRMDAILATLEDTDE